MQNIQLETCTGSAAAPLVDPFYEKFGFRGRARADDVFFLAKSSGSLIGSVRFCVEVQTPMLRTMMIADEYRRSGVGRRLLAYFGDYVDERGVKDIFCLPYSHLSRFYGSIGFIQIPFELAPAFLQARMNEYAKSGDSNICMKRL